MQKEVKEPRSKPVLEGAVKRAVKRVLEQRGAYWNMPIPPGNINTLDFLCCIPVAVTADMVGKTIGAFVVVETKRPGVKTVTPKQAETMRTIRRAGGVAILVNVVNEDEIAEKIKWAIRTGYLQAQLATEG